MAACSSWPPPPRPVTQPVEGSPSSGNFAGLIDIGGRKLYLECQGTGSPIVILEAGLRNRGDVWAVQINPTSTQAMVMPAVAAHTRVCAYDRPGTTLGIDTLSRSDAVAMPRTARDTVNDLHALLRAAHISSPYVMAGHSTGGLIIRLFASTYPDDVAGMVFVDALPEDMAAHMTPAGYAIFVRLNQDSPKELAFYKDLETISFEASFDQMRAAAQAVPLKPMPLVVLSRGVTTTEFPGNVPADFGPALEQAWQIEQNRLAGLVPGAQHVIATRSGHYIQLEQPELVIQAILQVVDAVREPAAWPTKAP